MSALFFAGGLGLSLFAGWTMRRLAAEGLDEEPSAVEPLGPLGYSQELTDVLAAQRIAQEASAQIVELSL